MRKKTIRLIILSQPHQLGKDLIQFIGHLWAKTNLSQKTKANADLERKKWQGGRYLAKIKMLQMKDIVALPVWVWRGIQNRYCWVKTLIRGVCPIIIMLCKMSIAFMDRLMHLYQLQGEDTHKLLILYLSLAL
jgi:hypothetical protein